MARSVRPAMVERVVPDVLAPVPPESLHFRDLLYEKRRILTAPIKHAEYDGLRITPNVYTTVREIDTFAAAVEKELA